LTFANFGKRKAFNHRHAPGAVVYSDVCASTPKQNDPRSCLGDVRACDCGALFFFPHTLGLYPVEVDLVIQNKAAKAARKAA
jgi:hypothetical protein